MKLFGWIEKWIVEHGSSAVLREHLALVKEKNSNLEAQKEINKATLKQFQDKKAALETKISELQILLANATKELAKLENVRGALLEQMQLQNRIRQLEFANQDLERQLRIKSIGF